MKNERVKIMAKKELIQTLKMVAPERVENTVVLATQKEKDKFITKLKIIIRSSMEYKDYIAFLREHVDLTKCAFFNNVGGKEQRRIRIEIHHEPLSLTDYIITVLNKFNENGYPLNDLLIAEEVMEMHYRNLVGVIPLSSTVHEVVHNNGNLIVPLYLIYGDYQTFMREFDGYIEDSMIEKLERKIEATKSIKEDSFEILEKQFTYLEVDGVNLPEKIEERKTQTC
jgi:hypothetical protein